LLKSILSIVYRWREMMFAILFWFKVDSLIIMSCYALVIWKTKNTTLSKQFNPIERVTIDTSNTNTWPFTFLTWDKHFHNKSIARQKSGGVWSVIYMSINFCYEHVCVYIVHHYFLTYLNIKVGTTPSAYHFYSSS
jgi:hypothetical protein